MRVAILADIHGNLPALEAVLADLGRVQPEVVVVNGDLVNRGPASREVVERLLYLSASQEGRKLAPKGLYFTLGNHDDLLVRWARRDPSIAELYQDPLFAPAAWSAGQLSHEHLDWLAGLPYQVVVSEEGVFCLKQAEGMGQPVALRVTHGSPRHYREGYDEQALGALEEIEHRYPAQLFVGSHTHRPFMGRLERALVLNSGAVGSPFNGDARAQYLVVELGEGHLRVEFRQVPYDLEAALRAFYDSGLMEEGGLGAEIFYQETRTARSLLMNFWRWAEAEGRPRDWEAWRAYRAAHPERFLPPLR
ncbi:phosphodiesterase [Meiothermus luteus]|uniref:Phosphodiesterase n=1 Tax=Meiothermus luteus TaxID=2026184 RepID=A0A399EKI1_9DEIN|nr:metallophosphoesterase [Meiothermus luteus]RIH82892.1 phosphodiesterase [Meiothermus luteus]RMH53486.1 MAG: metallophosphoesterase [Deinococcota bacterium]